MIERAYELGEALGLAVWGQDEAGPFPTEPYATGSWAPEGHPASYPHEHQRNGTAKLLTRFHPASGHVRVKGVTTTVNTVVLLHTADPRSLPQSTRGRLSRRRA